MSLPVKWSPLWNEYPDYNAYPLPEDVKTLVGGGADADWITNTCAIRLSRTLNYNRLLVPGNFGGLRTVKGADKKHYAFRVRELRKWLNYKLGKPNFDLAKKVGDAFDKTTLAATKGIIAFDIHLKDATGHFDLWNGSEFSHEGTATPNYWFVATRISLWEALAD